MAYVRKRGSQVLIVRGERDPETQKVQQRILFAFYSKAEALEALGRGQPRGDERFRHLLERQYPDIKLNWRAINRAVAANLHVLPDTYEYRAARLRERFRSELCGFAKQLMLADPQTLASAAEVIKEHQHELEYLSGLISWRLSERDQESSEWTEDNPFFWRFALHGSEVPPEVEEEVAGYYERGEYEKAEAIFRLLIDSFDNYAEGYNYLGLIAYERRDLEAATKLFAKTAEVGRRLFPKVISKKRYWSDLETRPYMRGLRNLAMTHNEAGRFDEALALCQRLEDECADDITATWQRAAIYLNQGNWRGAADSAGRLRKLFPDASLMAALALHELGDDEEAVVAFLHGALNEPRTARMLVGERLKRPKEYDEIKGHNDGVELGRALHEYVRRQSRASKRFWRDLIRDPSVVRLLDEAIEVVRRRSKQHRTGEREAFDRMMTMRSPEFARTQAAKLLGVAPSDHPSGATIH